MGVAAFTTVPSHSIADISHDIAPPFLNRNFDRIEYRGTLLARIPRPINPSNRAPFILVLSRFAAEMIDVLEVFVCAVCIDRELIEVDCTTYPRIGETRFYVTHPSYYN